ncbi:hypothetical protein ACJJTC_009298 [Scirpophaga incertulas]
MAWFLGGKLGKNLFPQGIWRPGKNFLPKRRRLKIFLRRKSPNLFPGIAQSKAGKRSPDFCHQGLGGSPQRGGHLPSVVWLGSQAEAPLGTPSATLPGLFRPDSLPEAPGPGVLVPPGGNGAVLPPTGQPFRANCDRTRGPNYFRRTQPSNLPSLIAQQTRGKVIPPGPNEPEYPERPCRGYLDPTGGPAALPLQIKTWA